MRRGASGSLFFITWMNCRMNGRDAGDWRLYCVTVMSCIHAIEEKHSSGWVSIMSESQAPLQLNNRWSCPWCIKSQTGRFSYWSPGSHTLWARLWVWVILAMQWPLAKLSFELHLCMTQQTTSTRFIGERNLIYYRTWITPLIPWFILFVLFFNPGNSGILW